MSDEDDKKPAIFGMNKKPDSAPDQAPDNASPGPIIPPAPPPETPDIKQEPATPPVTPPSPQTPSPSPSPDVENPYKSPEAPPPRPPVPPSEPEKKLSDSPSSAVKDSDFDTDFDDLDDDDFAADGDDDLEQDDLSAFEDDIEGEFESDFDDLDSDFSADDDFEEEFGDEGEPPGPAAKGKKPKADGQKSFVMKHFNTIVIGIAALVAVGIFVTQFMSIFAPPAQTPDQGQNIAQVEDALPQPAPIAPPPPPARVQPQQEEVLTPMPAPDSEVVRNTQLPDLDIDQDSGEPVELAQLNSRPAPPPPPPPPPGASPLDNAAPQESLAEELPLPADPLEQDTDVQEPEQQSAPEPEETNLDDALGLGPDTTSMPEPLELPEPVIVPDEESAEETAAAPDIEQTEAMEEPEDIPEEAAPLEDPVKSPRETELAQAEAETELPETMPALAEEQPDPHETVAPPPTVPAQEPSPADPAMQEKIQAANERIAQLTAMLDQMENKIEELEEEETIPAPAPQPAEETPAPQTQAENDSADNILQPIKPPRRPDTVPDMKPEPVEETRAVEKIPATPPKTQAPAPAKTAQLSTAAKTPQWKLRSAQIGRAVVSDKNTGDLRSVELGDTLPGIGKILSIAPENGRWIVKGSSGNISQ